MFKKLNGIFAFLLLLFFIVGQAQAAVTVTLEKSYRTDNSERVRIGTIAFDSSYPTGGESITADDLNLDVIRNFTVEANSGYLFEYDKTNSLMKVYYPSGSPAVSNAAEATHTHAASDSYGPGDITGVTVGTPALTHNADPTGNLAALPLYCVESYGAGGRNICQLFSTTNADGDILGSTDGVSGITGAATPRFYVNDSDAPGGVKIYVVDATPWGLEFVSPTATDAYIMMPFEAIADGVPGFAYAVKVTHAADAATGVELEFDDNGAADAQLTFVDAGTSSRVISAADIEVVAPSYMAIAQTSGVSSAGASHTHTATATAEAADEVGSGDSLAALTAVRFYVVGY